MRTFEVNLLNNIRMNIRNFFIIKANFLRTLPEVSQHTAPKSLLGQNICGVWSHHKLLEFWLVKIKDLGRQLSAKHFHFIKFLKQFYPEIFLEEHLENCAPIKII